MITLTFAGDESGDVSFSFGKGASRHFVMAMLATENPEGLRRTLAQIRTTSGLPTDYEFKFHDLTSAALRNRTFITLAMEEFESWAIIVDKTILPDSFKVMHGLDFYVYFATELICAIPDDKREGATLILDEFGSAASLRAELRRVIKIRGIPFHYKRLQIKRSRSEPLLQIADLIAGAVLHRDSYRSVSPFEIIQGRLCKIVDFKP